jgi:hypothetical protein
MQNAQYLNAFVGELIEYDVPIYAKAAAARPDVIPAKAALRKTCESPAFGFDGIEI